ncbi:hypothetical protein ABID37_003685 [Aquamicrobium terrae]|uniref:Uncharacterized protein n=1 Tax=Aquamicrobium terrae TaxID=1324945 RepID=A0ABV2N310_9HYPH
MYRATRSIPVSNKIIGRIDEVETICKYELHHATFDSNCA